MGYADRRETPGRALGVHHTELRFSGHGIRWLPHSRKGADVAAELTDEGLTVEFVQLDVTDAASVADAADAVGAHTDALDALVNNAGGTFDFTHPVLGSDLDHVQRIVDANCIGAWRVTNAFLPLLQASPAGRIVNVTSEAGSFTAAQGLPHQGDRLAGYAVARRRRTPTP